MAEPADIVARVRRELGDFGTPFRTSFLGDGSQKHFELPAQSLNAATVSITTLVGTTLTLLVKDTDYTLDARNGLLTVVNAPSGATTLLVEGTSYGLFSDSELTQYVYDAALQHISGRIASIRYKDTNGFIKYSEDLMTLDTLPEIEDYLVAMLATIEALWTLSTDAAMDVDIQTAEGTFVPRAQRYSQLREQIDLLTEKYHTHCAQLNVGLFRIEVSQLRRVSRSTGRLIPIFREREYDDYGLPDRLLPEIDVRNKDESGIPSSAIGGWW